MFTQLRTRLLLSSVVTVAIVLAALALIFFFQLRFAERAQTIANVRGTAIMARELSLYRLRWVNQIFTLDSSWEDGANIN